MRWIRERLGVGCRDAGVTLVEVLVAMIITSVLGAVITAAFQQVVHGVVRNDDEDRGLQDAKIILDRMGRDVREARGVSCIPEAGDTLCNAHLQVWVDANSDYVQQPSEVITWRLVPDPDGVHHDVNRIVGEGTPGAVTTREASTLIVNIAFSYDTPGAPNNAQTVTMGMQYDAFIGTGSKARSVEYTVRLRNKGSK